MADPENVCVHCGEAKPTPHVAVLSEEAYCEECWDAMCREVYESWLESR